MVEIKQNKSNSVTGDAVTQAAQPAAEPQAEQPKLISKGEKLYNRVVYSWLNYWVNLVSSIAIADYFTNHSGRVQLDKVISKTAKGLTAMGMGDVKKTFHTSKTAWETLALTSGGWLLLIPMKLMEDHKRAIVHRLNEKLGVDQSAPDGHKLNADEIFIEKEQPKQTWLNVIKRRMYGTVAVVAAGQAIEYGFKSKTRKRTDTFEVPGEGKWTEERLVGGKQVVTDFVSEKINWGAERLPGGKSFVASKTAQNWLDLAVLDTVFTKITATVMYLTNGAKAPSNKQAVPAKKNTAEAMPVADAVVPTPEASAPAPAAERKWAKTTPPADAAYAQRVALEQQQNTLQPGLR